jgi:hypothetical protein
MMNDKAQRPLQSRVGPLWSFLRRGKDERQTGAESRTVADMLKDAAEG